MLWRISVVAEYEYDSVNCSTDPHFSVFICQMKLNHELGSILKLAISVLGFHGMFQL